MPIKSKAQWKFLAAKHPKLFKKFKAHTKKGYKSLPNKKGKKK